jgi:hypothetical protein
MMRATHEQQGIWFNLISYCTREMNGGRIEGGQSWTDAMWMRIGASTAAFMAQESPLWRASCGTIIVQFYDVQAENAYKRKQKAGKLYAEKRWNASHERKIVKISVKDGSPIGQPNGSFCGSPNA